MAGENKHTTTQGEAVDPASALFGIDDPRLAILRKAPSETLVALIGESVAPKLECSLAFFALGMSQEFRKTEPPVFLELVFQVLRERMPNDKHSNQGSENEH